MQKRIENLIPDIYELLKRKDGWLTPELGDWYGAAASERLQAAFVAQDRGTLRLSRMGNICPRALWYSVHHPELAEPLQPWTYSKFAIGHQLEAWALMLVKAAGHTVEGEQDVLELDGVLGHRDCVIDGCTVDVKSAASFSFKKFKTGSIEQDDLFGYLPQLDGYVVASADDPLVLTKDKGYLLAIDKQLGHMCLHEHRINKEEIRDRVREYKRIVGLSSSPQCTCSIEREYRTGNFKLDTRASYSSHKYSCFSDLKCYVTPKGPVYYTKVLVKPDGYLVDRFGNSV